jgi:hypothetical protein
LRVDRSLASEFIQRRQALSFRMEVKVEKDLEGGPYDAKVVNVEQKETKFGDRLMWTFDLPNEGVQVVGFTSMSPSTKAKAYQWAAAIAGDIDPKLGWGPEDLIGGECVEVLEVVEDAQGTKKNKVVKVKPPREGRPKAVDTTAKPDAPESGPNRLAV